MSVSICHCICVSVHVCWPACNFCVGLFGFEQHLDVMSVAINPPPPSFLPSVSPPSPPSLQPSIDHFLILHCVPEPSQQPAPVYKPLSPTSMDISWSPPDYPNGVIMLYRLFRNDTLVFEDNGEPALEDF